MSRKLSIFLIVMTYFSTLSLSLDNTVEKFDGNPFSELKFQLSGSNLLWPRDSTKNAYEKSGRYIPRNVIVTRLQFLNNAALLTLPRYKPGVPFTLGKVELNTSQYLTKISPYPDWAIQEEGNCQALQSVVDIFLDHNGFLWALDIGIVNTLEQPIRHCGPKIVAINTADDTVVKQIDLNSFVTAESRLQFLIVNYEDDERPYVYVSDAGARTILAYDIIGANGFHIVLPEEISPTYDILYIALVAQPDDTLTLYFTYLSSPRLYSIKTDYLTAGYHSDYINDVGLKPFEKQLIILGTDGGNSLLFRYKGENDIYMWNTETGFKPTNLHKVKSGTDYRLTTQVSFGPKRLMWALESNFHDFISNTTGYNGASVILYPITL